MRIKRELAALADKMFKQKATWPELIKQIRSVAQVDIFTAEKIALSHEGWRRLCEHMINHDQECRRQAAYHVKHHGPRSLVAMIDGRYVVKAVAT